LHGWKTWPLTLKEDHKFRVFGNKVLRRITETTKEEDRENYIMMSSVNCTLHLILLGL
jgi:hypothetical protein